MLCKGEGAVKSLLVRDENLIFFTLTHTERAKNVRSKMGYFSRVRNNHTYCF